MSGITSRFVIRPRFHQKTMRIVAGSEHVTVLLKSASAKRTTENTYHRSSWRRRRNDFFFGGSSCSGGENLKYASIDARKNPPERTFFLCVTHATDSTLTGCSAK